MSSEHLDIDDRAGEEFGSPQDDVVAAERAPEYPEEEEPAPREGTRRVALPLVLFLATCATTFMAGTFLGGYFLSLVAMILQGILPDAPFFAAMFWAGFCYSAPLMVILGCHEAGHFLQAHRYKVRASLPYFIPVPLPPLGTFGAVIAMDSKVRSRKALFDIGITGPLAGLVPTMIFCVWGLQLSEIDVPRLGGWRFGDPLIFKFLAQLILEPIPAGHDIMAHPLAFAGWVGLLVTSLNLLPIGQLDGGHILYALLRENARRVALVVLVGVTIAVIVAAAIYHYPGWILMLVLLLLIGPNHPPTDDDNVRLGPVRTVLGWLTLAFIFLGLTPMPIIP